MSIKHQRPQIMGILNVTPDSFSDGGKFNNIDKAIKHALSMIEQGADIIDVGGESTRPGAKRIDSDEQIRRTVNIIQELKKHIPEDIIISIDTTSSQVAQSAFENGARMVNDISAGRDDPDMLKLISKHNISCVLMHMQGTPETMQDNPQYENVVSETLAFLLERASTAERLGVKKENVYIDPGIGFGKTRDHNLALMANLQLFVNSGYPVLLGTSRKRFMGSICSASNPEDLTGATCATTVLGVQAGVKIFRVHDVKENRQAADVAWTIKNSK